MERRRLALGYYGRRGGAAENGRFSPTHAEMERKTEQ